MANAGRDALEWSIAEDVPDGRCGFKVEYPDVPGVPGSVVCWRQSWAESDSERCIWHADVADKSAGDLAGARTDTWERLDGAVLREAILRDAVSFEGCTLTGANCIEADFRGANFKAADLIHTDLRRAAVCRAGLRNADLSGADIRNADFTGAFLVETALVESVCHLATFKDAVLRKATLTDAELFRADLTQATLRDATLIDANLEAATLRETTLAATKLDGAKPYDSQFVNAHLNPQTSFGEQCGYDREANALFPAAVAERIGEAATNGTRLVQKLDATVDEFAANLPTQRIDRSLRSQLPSIGIRGHQSLDHVPGPLRSAGNLVSVPITWTRDHLGAAVEVYRRWRFLRRHDRARLEFFEDRYDKAHTTYRLYEQLARENALPGKISAQFRRGKDARRRQAIVEGDYHRWGYAALQRRVMGYGERPWRVVRTSLVVIALFGLTYPLLGGVYVETGGTPLRVFDPLATPLGEIPGRTWLVSFYFSLATFTTLGAGDIQPGSTLVQLLAGIESLIGASLIALLVAVLTRRITR